MPKRRPKARASQPDATRIRLRRIPGPGEAWEIVPPRCAVERADDLAEVQAMIDAGEFDVAVDELRWLLDGCGDLLEAHQLLGEIALAQGDVRLARAHFGYAYQIVTKAMGEGFSGALPADRPANRVFYEAVAGLVECLVRLEKSKMLSDVVARVRPLDPADPLGLASLGPDGKRPPEEPEVYQLG